MCHSLFEWLRLNLRLHVHLYAQIDWFHDTYTCLAMTLAGSPSLISSSDFNSLSAKVCHAVGISTKSHKKQTVNLYIYIYIF